MYLDATLNFWMYAKRPFNPNEVLIFTREKYVTRIRDALSNGARNF